MIDSSLRSLISRLIKEQDLIQVVLGSPKSKASPKKVNVKPVFIKNTMHYQFSFQQEQKVLHENILSEKCAELLIKLIPDYKQVFFYSKNKDYHILVNKKGKTTILEKAPSQKPLKMFSHNREKNYILKENTPISFLIELDIMSSSGKVFADKRDKFRQINRFLEMIEDIVSYLPKDKTLHIIDFGCGKAYLTFALYYYLHEQSKYHLKITGLDLKEDVVTFCQSIADKLGFSDLQFSHGDIKTYKTDSSVDLVVCLHACDTATDEALKKAVEWNAKVIMAVPCCQHELLEQVECEILNPLLKQGILKERFAALVTDAARAQWLEIVGYKTQILEFIDMEHTPKNLLIRAVRQPRITNKSKLIDNYNRFKNLLGIHPTIEKLLS